MPTKACDRQRVPKGQRELDTRWLPACFAARARSLSIGGRFWPVVLCTMAGDARFNSSGTRFGNGAGKGDGWGGPAKGASTAKPRASAVALIPGQPPEKRAITAAKHLTEAERATVLKDLVFAIAMNGERQETQLAAACKLLDRIEGTPISKAANDTASELAHLTDAELDAMHEAHLRHEAQDAKRRARILRVLEEEAVQSAPETVEQIYHRMLGGD